jgi:hypothetical protein
MVPVSGVRAVRNAALPVALACVSLGLSLAFVPKRAWAANMLVLAITSVIIVSLGVPTAWTDRIFLGCWISVAATASSVYMPRAIAARAASILSLHAGIWSGAAIALAGAPTDVLRTLPCVLACVPAAWIVRRDMPIVVKVASSWLIAIAILALTLQCLPVTPGYAPDHLE